MMPLNEFDKILKDYKESDFDYGFSAVSEEEYNSAINKHSININQYNFLVIIK